MKYSFFHIFLTLCIVFLLLINNFSFKDGVPTCDNFLVNNYLYLALSIMLLGLGVNSLKTWDYTFMNYMYTFLFSIVLIILISTQNTFQKTMTEVVLSHIYWVLFVLFLSISMAGFLGAFPTQNYMNSTIMLVSAIFVMMSSVVYLFPDFFMESYNFAMLGLLIALICIIIIELFSLLFANRNDLLRTYKYTSYAVVFIFSLLISYDTSRVITQAKQCEDYPNYPKTSTSFLLDIVNLFKRIMLLRRR